jgi:beta-galactosidase
VYIIGKFIGQHKGGYTAFTFDIYDYVTIPGKNIISVKVDNSKKLDLLSYRKIFCYYFKKCKGLNHFI